MHLIFLSLLKFDLICYILCHHRLCFAWVSYWFCEIAPVIPQKYANHIWHLSSCKNVNALITALIQTVILISKNVLMLLFKVFDLDIVLFRILDQLSFLKSAWKKNFSGVDIKNRQNETILEKNYQDLWRKSDCRLEDKMNIRYLPKSVAVEIL